MPDKDYSLDANYVQDPLRKLLYRGKLFSAGLVVDSVDSAGAVQIVFNARSSTLHVSPGWSFSGNGHVHAYEVNSWTSGSAINPSNNFTKYQGVNSIQSQLVLNPTSINVQPSSAALWDQFIPGGIKTKATGGTGIPSEHFIIEQGTIIMLELENHSGGGATIGFEAVIHENPIAELDDPE